MEKNAQFNVTKTVKSGCFIQKVKFNSLKTKNDIQKELNGRDLIEKS